MVWFGEALESPVLDKAFDLVGECDICLVVGTSSVRYATVFLTKRAAAAVVKKAVVVRL